MRPYPRQILSLVRLSSFATPPDAEVGLFWRRAKNNTTITYQVGRASYHPRSPFSPGWGWIPSIS